MVTPLESRAALELVTGEAVATAAAFLTSTAGSPEARRAVLLEGVPQIVGYFSEGSAALAADFYEEERELSGARRLFVPELVIADRTVKERRAIVWAADPLFEGDELLAASRLAEVVQLGTARPYRDTVLGNRRRDPEAVGWRRISSGNGCKFCRMLADRGAVYKRDTATFASHEHCNCTAQPVFVGSEPGPEASVMQYTASKRGRTPAQKAALRAYLNANY
jgi:hypothetical protein